MHRFEYNKRYAGVKKCASPACCNLHCCGNKFGVHSGRVKRVTRRYYRHAIKSSIKIEIEWEIQYIDDEMMAYERMMDE